MVPAVNPLTNKTWANITDWASYVFNYYGGLGAGFLSNIYGGYGNLAAIEEAFVTAERYRPRRLELESRAMLDWTNCPDLSYDFDDHYNEISVPVIAFASGLGANKTGQFQFVRGTANPDFTGLMLPKYGHYDVFFGTFAVTDVNQPALEWMLNDIAGFKTTAFCDVTVMLGWSWWFFVHSKGGNGAYTYQWYEGTAQLQGQTSMVLQATRNTPGTYTFYCKVTDSGGTTAISSIATLTVR